MSKRIYNRRLTRDWLDEVGITIDWDAENQNWWVNKYAEYRGLAAQGRVWIIKHRNTHLSEHTIITPHPFGTDTIYNYYTFSYQNKVWSIPTARLVYAYFKGEVPEGYEVDHIDDNSLNNRLENLQLLTPAQNKQKRKNKGGQHVKK